MAAPLNSMWIEYAVVWAMKNKVLLNELRTGSHCHSLLKWGKIRCRQSIRTCWNGSKYLGTAATNEHRNTLQIWQSQNQMKLNYLSGQKPPLHSMRAFNHDPSHKYLFGTYSVSQIARVQQMVITISLLTLLSHSVLTITLIKGRCNYHTHF